jgi:peptide/nickel transport system permease protein
MDKDLPDGQIALGKQSAETATAWQRAAERRYTVSLIARIANNKKALIGVLMVSVVVVVAILSNWMTPYDPYEMGGGAYLSPPSSQNLLGTDVYGRDQLSRLMVGAQLSLMVGVVVALTAVLVGMPFGLVSGYFGGAVDNLIMRVTDMMFAFPWVLVALFLATIIGPGLQTVLVALVLVYAPQLARLTRGATLSVREKEYVEAAIATGESDLTILFRYILPNVMSPIIVQATLFSSFAILSEASISYLGLGTQPPTASWGLMLTENSTYLEAAPHLSIFPGLSIAYTVLALNLLGDGLRDVFDPRYREG